MVFSFKKLKSLILNKASSSCEGGDWNNLIDYEAREFAGIWMLALSNDGRRAAYPCRRPLLIARDNEMYQHRERLSVKLRANPCYTLKSHGWDEGDKEDTSGL
jgi:hypothetical protein